MKERLMKNMGYLIVLLDVAIYFILSYVFIDGFQENLLTVFVNGALLFIGAMIATTSMMNQGLLNGGEAEKYKDTLKYHLQQKQKIYTKLPKLQKWLDKDHAKLMKIGRSIFINSAGYDYDKVFTENGKFVQEFKVAKPEEMTFKRKWWAPIKLLMKFNRWMYSEEWHVYREKKKFIRRAKRYTVTQLTVSDLMNIDAGKDPNNFGITEKQYVAQQTGMNTISRLIFSCLLPTISFSFLGFNKETFMIQLINIVLILMTAFFAMFCAYSFKVRTHRATIIKKINKLEEFDNSDLKELEDKKEDVKEEQSNGLCSKISENTESSMVEEIHGDCESREENNIHSNSDTGV